jgi:hypothetical protein
MSNLSKKLKELNLKTEKASKEPLWKGPQSEDPNGGVTFSLLSRWLNCRERARITLIEGLKPTPVFNHRLEFGNMWHECAEGHAGGEFEWYERLERYVEELNSKYPLEQSQIHHWYRICSKQFPLYVKFWQDHPDMGGKQPIYQEEVFNVPYRLPSGRSVYLRGKWDSVDLVTRGVQKGVWLQENKTKGDVKPVQMQRQLKYDLQTMLYLVALTEHKDLSKEGLLHSGRDGSIRGVRYNVIRRPLSGGKGTIRQHKATKNKRAETADEFYERVAEYIRQEPEDYFMRWNVEVTPKDIGEFKRKTLNPLLEELYKWYVWMQHCQTYNFDPFGTNNRIHWQHPFGVVNQIDSYGQTDLDSYLETGSMVGLTRVSDLFTELR